MSAAAADLPLFARALLALVLVLALLLAARWALARQASPAWLPMRRRDWPVYRRTLALDARTRLVVMRRGQAEVLLAVGPHGVSRLDFRIVADRPGSPRPALES